MYVNKMQEFGNRTPLGYVLKAQSFWSLSQFDSAIYYAKYIMGRSDASPQDQYNMLYILAYNDSTIDNEQIKRYTEDRGDIGIDIDKQHQSLAHAIALLEQELSRKPDLRWLYASIVTILLSLAIVILYRIHQKKKHALISQKIAHITAEYSEIQSNIKIQLEKTCTMLRSSDNLKNDLHWKDFDNMCEFVNENLYLFINKLKHEYILNETEIRLCVLVLLDLNRKQIADILPYAQNGVGKFKYRVAQKLGTNGKDLRQFLIQIAVRETGIHP